MFCECSGVFFARAEIATSGPDICGSGALIPAGVTFLVLLFEDIPQIVLQSIYFQTLGLENADDIAIFAFVCSCLSLSVNFLTMVVECNRY